MKPVSRAIDLRNDLVEHLKKHPLPGFDVNYLYERTRDGLYMFTTNQAFILDIREDLDIEINDEDPGSSNEPDEYGPNY